ncbi:MAG: hypothetical protein IVW57_13610, partial [Ktedonobacterales bacterium]|nr:hypothetical protein [Ktedonobacterales bacterium]
LVMRALELSPAQRQQSAHQLQDEISVALNMLEYASSGGYVLPRRPNGPPLGGETSGKRVAVGAGGAPRGAPQVASGNGRRGTGLQPAMPARGAKQPIAVPDAFDGGTSGQRSARQPAAMPNQQGMGTLGQRTAQQAAVMADRISARQPVVAPFPGSGAMAAMAAPTRGSSAYAPDPRARDYEAQPRRAAVAVAEREDEADARAQGVTSAWLRLGTTPLSAFGKWMLAFAGVEVLWGTVVLAVGILELVNRSKPFPLSQFALAWGVAVVLLSALGGQALSRPVYRHGRVSKGRRAFQGTCLFLYTLAVHAVAVWGATVFIGAQANSMLAVIAFLLFGVNVLVVGALSIANLLG